MSKVYVAYYISEFSGCSEPLAAFSSLEKAETYKARQDEADKKASGQIYKHADDMNINELELDVE